MQSKQNTSIDEIIAGIDNDFNLDNTDWIPRIAAWTIDVLSQLKCTVTEKKRVKLPVVDKIARSQFSLDINGIKVIDCNGCEVVNLDKVKSCCGTSSMGDSIKTTDHVISATLRSVDNSSVEETMVMAVPTGFSEYEYEGNKVTYENHIVGHGNRRYAGEERSYVLVDDKTIELNFNTDFICIEYEGIKTTKSDVYGCELPVIPNNGILKEAIKYYCMYKILCRGVKHPVFNLAASQYGTNPYFMWTQLREKAKRSVIIDSQGEMIDDKGAWKHPLIDFTFD